MPNQIIRFRLKTLLRRLSVFLILILLFYTFIPLLQQCASYLHSVAPSVWSESEPPVSLFMTRNQCRAAFPEYDRELVEAVEKGAFRMARREEADMFGPNYGRIKDGKLYMISVIKDVSEMMLQERTASFHQIHRALLTSSEPLPDIVFALNILDNPLPGTWSYSRPVLPPGNLDQGNPIFPMPHFSYYSWPKPYIGPLSKALSHIATIEESTPWAQKIDKAVWRGTAWFTPAGRPEGRRRMLEVAREKGKSGKEKGEMKPWADIESTKKGNELRIEDFCRYRYVVYAEGVTYSGRLPYHQACASVLISPPMTYLQHTTHLIRPLFSWSLPLSASSGAQDLPSKQTPNPDVKSNITFPVSYPPSQANAIFVSANWDDLEATVQYLQSHPEIGETIARNQREVFVGSGYLSDAAEACYWRELIRAWSNAVVVDEEEWEEGMLWEDYVLTGKVKWD
ncbi:glycosyl transferase family 90-domain-containing protein [Xylogone sp. PMI_703]|nr:glycosyl transferase family 90-domain-containing protein [Xylogone sp. PMI_703]